EDAITRLVLPSLYEEARRELNEAAEAHALEVFARNLRSLLLAAPAPGKRVLGVDPGYKTGCHYAAMDALGRVLQAEGGAPATGTLQIIGDDRAVAASRKRLAALITGHAIDLIALGNGKACRSTEAFIAAVLAEELPESGARYAIVNEAGASAYSTSTIGREELPDLEPPARCAVSIGRRLQDPLAELAKIDPASVGVGLYQHDLRDKPAAEALEDVVAACVGCVGVDANTAGAALLRHVPGLNPLTARRVVQHRAEHGAFATLDALREAMKLSDAAYQQAAGVLRIAGGDNPLDATRVHPESYATAEALLAELGATPQTLGDADALAKLQQAAAACDRPALAAELGVGPRKLDQLLDALTKPGADPRAASPGPITRRAVVKLEDLQPGAELRGTVQNVVDFGAFIDIGLRDSGLVHISRMSTGYVSSPHDLVAVGDAVRVWVASVDADKRRVALSLVEPGSETKKPARGPRRRGGPPRSGGKGGAGSGQPAATGDSTDATGAPKTASGRSGSAGKRTGDGQRGSQQGNQRGSQQGGRPRHKQGGRGKPGRKDSARHSGRRPTTYETRSKAPPKPITPEMEQGAEAMRTFGDLLQFHRKKSQPSGKPEEPPTGKPEEQPTAPPAEQPAKASDGTQGEKPDENRPDENLPPQA
ncbi:MAG: helix-hairpin-helix domain-containing protein, partial [Planctomycetota bacterium]